MARTRKQPVEIEELTAVIETVEQTYYISEDQEHQPPVHDEALIDITGRIEQIASRHKQYLGQPIDISFGCSRSFSGQERTPTTDKLFLLSMRIGKQGCGCMAYLPADAFWAIGPMIRSGAVTHIQASYERPRYGSGPLLSIYLAPGIEAYRLTAPVKDIEILRKCRNLGIIGR
jgi:hypothetical protein